MRFDHLWAEVQRLNSLCEKRFNCLYGSMRRARCAAYRFAKKIIEVRTQFPNEFREQVMSEGLDIDAWMDRHFAVIEQTFNQDRRILFANIEKDMTLREYARHGDLWTAHKERVQPIRAEIDVEAPLPKETLPPEEQNRLLKARCESQAILIRDLNQQNRSLRSAMAIIERKFANLLKVFKTGSAKAKAQ